MAATVIPVSPTPTRARAIIPSPVFGTSRRDLVVAGVLSGVAGYVDAAGFLGLYGLYAAHVTGDLVTAGTALGAGLSEGLPLRLSAILVFMISVATAALVARTARRRDRRPLTALFALMTAALTLFCAAGILLQPQLRRPDAWAVVVTGAVGVFGMGIQNALMRDVLCSLGATTLMTGNLTQLTMDLVEVVLPDDGNGSPGESEIGRRRTDTRRRLAKSSTAVFGFLFGTVLGGIAITVVGFWSIALPAFAAGALTFATWHQSSERQYRLARHSRALPAARPPAPLPKRISGVQEVEPIDRPWAARPRPRVRAANDE